MPELVQAIEEVKVEALAPYWTTHDGETVKLYHGHVLEVLRRMQARSVHCVVTSPPYWGLRDYGTASWVGGSETCLHTKDFTPRTERGEQLRGMGAGSQLARELGTAAYRDVCSKCGAKRVDQQIGAESSPEEYVANMVLTFREVRRILRDDGTLWLNLGSTYASGGIGPIQSPLLRRAPACGTGDTILLGSQDAGHACRDSYDEYQDATPNRHADSVRTGQSVLPAGQPTLPTSRDTARSGCDQASPVVSPRGALQSTIPQSSCQPLVASDPALMASAFLQARQTSPDDARQSSRSSVCTSGTVPKSQPLVVRTVGTVSFFSACQRSDCLGVGKCGLCWCSLSIPSLNVKAGDLVVIPNLVALALQADGWVLRQDIIWYSPNKMPESVTNRCTKSHEHVFLLAKSSRYYYDAEAIKEPAVSKPHARGGVFKPGQTAGPMDRNGSSQYDECEQGRVMGSDKVNKRDVWIVPTRGYPGAHFACVDDQTEALTKGGWKLYNELRDGEEIAMYDGIADKMKWGVATIHRYDYDGELVVFDKRDTSQALTPNHRCILKHRKGHTKVKEAQYISSNDHFLMAAEFVDECELSIGEDMASIIGWYTAEGHTSHNGKDMYISQSQTVNPEKVAEIESILKRLNADYRKHWRDGEWNGEERNMAVFSIRGMLKIKIFEVCKKKHISDTLTRLPKNELKCLLGAFISGDGHTRVSDGRKCIIQKDKRRIEQLQIIAIKLGHRCHMTRRSDGVYVLYLTDGRWLTTRGSRGVWDGLRRKQYKGVVWCPNVETGFWLARRDGKPFITGNTYSPQLITPMILAGTSEHGCCELCGAQWERVVERVGGVVPGGDDSGGKDRDRSFDSSRNGKPGSGSTLDGVPAGKVTVGWRPTCECGSDSVVPATVLDPFIGSGTTCATAVSLGRRGVGVDLSEVYLRDHAVPRCREAVGAAAKAAMDAGLIPRPSDGDDALPVSFG